MSNNRNRVAVWPAANATRRTLGTTGGGGKRPAKGGVWMRNVFAHRKYGDERHIDRGARIFNELFKAREDAINSSSPAERSALPTILAAFNELVVCLGNWRFNADVYGEEFAEAKVETALFEIQASYEAPLYRHSCAIEAERLLSQSSPDSSKRRAPRSLPLPKVELVRRILNKTDARAREGEALLAKHGLEPEVGNRWTVLLSGFDDEVKKRLTEARPAATSGHL